MNPKKPKPDRRVSEYIIKDGGSHFIPKGFKIIDVVADEEIGVTLVKLIVDADSSKPMLHKKFTFVAAGMRLPDYLTYAGYFNYGKTRYYVYYDDLQITKQRGN